MKSLLILSAAAIAISATAATPVQTPCEGRIDRWEVYSPQMKDTVTVDIWLSSQYLENPDKKFPVLYMHDGQNLFDAATTWNHQSWEMDSVVSALASRNEIVAPVIVGVHSVAETRLADLMPIAPFAESPELNRFMDIKTHNQPLRGDAYAAFVSSTLRDSIENSYRVLTGPENTAVMGSSMGGLMSVYMFCEYPEVYGSAGCLSTHWVGMVESYENGDERFPKAMYEYIEARIPRDGKHKIYFDRGTATIDAYYDKWDNKIISMVEGAGYSRPEFLDSFVAIGAPHEENAWKARVDRPLKFMFRTMNASGD